MQDSALNAFRRLLADASRGGQAKVDALVALSQRTVFVPIWPDAEQSFRSVVSSAGLSALPLYSTHEGIDEAAQRFGWLRPDGTTLAREVGARAALGHALAQNLLVVVDLGEPHSLEIDRNEMTPLLSQSARRDSQGPFAGTGRLSSSLIQAVRPTPRPSGTAMTQPITTPTVAAARQAQGTAPTVQMSTPTPPVAAPAVPVAPPAGAAGVSSATFGAGPGTRVTKLATAPDDALLDAMTEVLREYPEVEWACLAAVARGPAAAVPAVLVRIDPSFRTRVAEVMGALRQSADARGARLDLLLADDAATMRAARAEGLPFYPWRR